MYKNIILVVKGFIMGIANIIPGVSGGTLALILGIYEDFIKAISHFTKNIKENLKFLIPIIIGMGLAIVLLSRVIDYSYEHYPIPTILFFVGLVVGGIPLLYKKVKGTKETRKASSYVILLLMFGLVMFMTFSKTIFGEVSAVSFSNMNIVSYILLFLVGMVAAATMVIPGVSGSLVLMILGYYNPVLDLIKDVTKFKDLGTNIIVLGVFGLGIVIGIVLVSKLIEFLFKKYEVKTYFGVLGFILASVLAIPISAFLSPDIKISFNIIQIIIGIALFAIGAIISSRLGDDK